MKILNIIHDFIANYPELISIQLYECIEGRTKNTITFEVKPTHYYYTRPSKVANLIHEQYFLSKKLYDKYKELVKEHELGKNDKLLREIKRMNDYLIECDKKKRIVTEEIVNTYSLLAIIFQMILGDKNYKCTSLSNEYIEKIEDYKRTGFLKGIICEGYLKFTHSGNNYKKDRYYVTKCIDIESRNHMFVMIFEKDSTTEDMDDFLDNAGKKFYDTLSKHSDVVYNDYV